MEVIDILPYPPQLQEEHKDPYVLDRVNNIIVIWSNFCFQNIAQKSFILKLR